MPDTRLAALSSPDLIAALERTAAEGRKVTADLIALLAECDARQLFASEGYPSLFEFCVARLRLSEAQAYHRIQAARAVRHFPLVLDRLREGRVSLTAVALLREHLTEANHRDMLDWADGRRKREVEEFVRNLDPYPEARPSLRRLAAPRTPVPLPVDPIPESASSVKRLAPALAPAHAASAQAAEAMSPELFAGSALHRRASPSPTPPLRCTPLEESRPTRAEVRPTAPGRYSLRITISDETADKLRRAQALLGHARTADPALVLDRALTLLLAQLERRKAGAPAKRRDGAHCEAGPNVATETQHLTALLATEVPLTKESQQARTTASRAATARTGLRRPGSAARPASPNRRPRYISASVRRAVWDRDGGRCAYVSLSGIRCTATASLEFHHRVPFGEGGASTVENISLACTRHNAIEAARWFNFDRTEFGVGESECRGG